MDLDATLAWLKIAFPGVRVELTLTEVAPNRWVAGYGGVRGPEAPGPPAAVMALADVVRGRVASVVAKYQKDADDAAAVLAKAPKR